MTPLIDVTFLLIIFFMLVNNIITAEAEPMFVPELDDPKTREFDVENRIAVNVTPIAWAEHERQDNWLDWDSQPRSVKVGMEEYAMDQMVGVTSALKTWSDQVKARGKAPEILLRADGCLAYEHLQVVMAAITAAGIDKLHLVAYLPGERRP